MNGLAYDGGTTALGAVRLGSIPSSPTDMKKEDPKNYELPEGEGRGSRFESADLDIEELTEFLRKTPLEDEDAIHDLLSNRYGIYRKDSIGHMQVGMTRIFDAKKKDEGKPLSGKEPTAVARLTLKSLDDKEWDLRIFKLFNRNQKFRFEYILESADKFKEK